jgi:hypothetical protein
MVLLTSRASPAMVSMRHLLLQSSISYLRLGNLLLKLLDPCVSLVFYAVLEHVA